MKRRILQGAVAALTVVAAVSVVALASGSRGSTSPVADHWVDNLGDGVTASDFDGNSSDDCTTDAFLAGDYDLWHFVVNQASDAEAILAWNGDNSVWSDPSSVTVVDVTTQYGNYVSGDGTKHLWIATTPPGATLVSAYLDYDGTAGRENLSHACGRSTPTPGIRIDPEISYDMTWDWTVDKTVDWSVNPAGGYVLDYTVESNRSGVPRVIPGSLHVTDSVIVIPPTLVLSSLSVTFTQGAYSQPCAIDLAALHYDCELDVSRITKDPATGRPTGNGTLSASATYSGGTLTDSVGVSFDGVDPTTVYAETASLTDDYATPSDTADDPSTTGDLLEYTVNWTPVGTTCNERTNTATLLIDNPVPGTDNPTDTVTVRWCPPMKGLTIGYWGNKTGAPLVVARYTALKTLYPNVFALIPPLTTATAVRNFLQNASCTGTCQSMFAAQFLATAMNAIDPDFAAQGVAVDGECLTAATLLADAEAGATGATKTWYESHKSVFDSINNSRQSPCLVVID